MPKRKKFIDKKNSVTFHLVHRSQQDPLITDETAPKHVLLEVGDKQSKNNAKRSKEEQIKYGIYYDDNYDYMQHLRDGSDVRQVGWEKVEYRKPTKPDTTTQKAIEYEFSDDVERRYKIQLPSSVFASDVEEKVGLLNKAAPTSGLRLDLDPDIVAAMDEDFDYDDPDNQLEDNFIEIANAEPDGEFYDEDDDDDVSTDGEGYTSEERDDVASLDGPQYSFRDEETKSRFTEYSMSSSVMRRNDQLTLLDDRFEKMYADYDENEMGALDMDEIEGYIDPTADVLKQCLDEFEKAQTKEKIDTDAAAAKAKLYAEHEGSSDEDLVPFDITEKNVEKWDCESILSTYSNLYNHPKLITEPKGPPKIRVSAKTGIPVGVLGNDNRLTAKALARLDAENAGSGARNGPRSCAESVLSTLSTLSIRPKDETPEARHERKRLLREYRKERRLERRANAEAFKEEKKRQEKIMMNNRNNVQGNRIL